MTFNEWFDGNGYDEQHRAVFNSVWNAAIEEAAKVVEANYDPIEPWLEPSEIRNLAI